MDIQGVKAAYFTVCTQLNLPPRQVLMSGEGALLLLETRDEEVENIYVDVPPEVYDNISMMFMKVDTWHGRGLVVGNNVIVYRGKDTQPSMEIDNVFIYSDLTLLDQKIALLEMPDRKPEKIESDVLELDLLLAAVALHSLAYGTQRPSDEQVNRCKALFAKHWGK